MLTIQLNNSGIENAGKRAVKVINNVTKRENQ